MSLVRMRKRRRSCTLLLTAVLLSACRLSFPDEDDITYYPSSANQVIGALENVYVAFGFDVDRSSAEALLAVEDHSGRVDGRYDWRGGTVHFVPVEPLIRSRRYVMSFDGVFSDADGHDVEAHHMVPFFSGSGPVAPLLVLEVSPGPGETIAPGSPIVVTFSRSADPVTAAHGVSLSPNSDRTTSWANGNTELTITASDGWEDRTIYTLEIEQEITDTDGVPLANPQSVTFLVQQDTQRPTITRVDGVQNSPPYDQVIVPDIDASGADVLDPADVLRWDFSETMDEESVEAAVDFDPPVSGTFYWTGEATMVFVPENGLEPGTSYRVTVTTRARDESGLSLDADGVSRFSTPATVLLVESIIAGTNTVLPPYSADGEADFTVQASDPAVITIVFSQAMSSAESRQSAVHATSLVLLIGTFDTTPTSYSWPDDRQLRISYGSLGSPGVEKSVLLTIRGGPNGARTPAGDQLVADVEQMFYVLQN